MRAARVRFSKAGQSEDTTWNLTAIEPGKPYIVHSTSTIEPDSAELTLWFEDTNMMVTIPSGTKPPYRCSRYFRATGRRSQVGFSSSSRVAAAYNSSTPAPT